MTRERDIERLLDDWFTDGPSQAPDRVIDAVSDRIGRESQRPAWRLHWSTTEMNRTVGSVAGLAAVIVIAVVGFAVLRGNGTSGGATPATPTGAPSASPVAPSATAAAGVPGACDLMTADEVGNTLHISTAVTAESWGVSDPTAPSRYCLYHATGVDPLYLSYEKESGVSTFANVKSNIGATAVSGLGDDAVWDPTLNVLYVLKGSRLVNIEAGEGQPPMTLDGARAVGAVVVGRM